MERKKLTIGHLFPEVLNMYGDRGNVLTLKNRLLWRDMGAEVLDFGLEDEIDFDSVDILLLGGGSQREQKLACERLKRDRERLSRYIENDGVFLALCGSFPMLGKRYYIRDVMEEGLCVLDIDMEPDGKKHIGDVILETEIGGEKVSVVGFENHSGITIIGSYQPFGTVCRGFGNDGHGGCGLVYKNLIATYLHGPLLPKNPGIADYILSQALAKKYGEAVVLKTLNDKTETEAHNFILSRYPKQ